MPDGKAKDLPGTAGAATAPPAQLCGHSRSKASCAGRKSPSLRSRGCVPLRAEAVWQSHGADARGGGSGTGGCRFRDGDIPAERRSFPFGPAVPLHGVFISRSKRVVSCFRSLPAFGAAPFRRVPSGTARRAKVGWRFSLYTSCVCSAKRCWKCHRAWPACGGLRRAQGWGATALNRDARPLPGCLCSGSDSGVRQALRVLCCPWEAARCRAKGRMSPEPAPPLLCGQPQLRL